MGKYGWAISVPACQMCVIWCGGSLPARGSGRTPGTQRRPSAAASVSGWHRHCCQGNAHLTDRQTETWGRGERECHGDDQDTSRRVQNTSVEQPGQEDLPGEKMSGLKRISNEVSLMEPTALQALRTTSRLLGSVNTQGESRRGD